ncbi:uncharacterized protein PV06_08109 [Exophiala oligosperma]|uniref:Uncharacterized protein n=1 Tax=Exophiala oligosperma TaxID=215243 RepID=A0A0D2D8V9_9EURO|nr:uncharacterized protein PV06_08109 [Exophiala oligosperma]KIW39503.1 hypothetical protein PV06_08109 [Exophiala oligosperma]
MQSYMTPSGRRNGANAMVSDYSFSIIASILTRLRGSPPLKRSRVSFRRCCVTGSATMAFYNSAPSLARQSVFVSASFPSQSATAGGSSLTILARRSDSLPEVT